MELRSSYSNYINYSVITMLGNTFNIKAAIRAPSCNQSSVNSSNSIKFSTVAVIFFAGIRFKKRGEKKSVKKVTESLFN